MKVVKAFLVFVGCAWCFGLVATWSVGADRAEELGTKFGDQENSVARFVLDHHKTLNLDFPAFFVGVEKAPIANISAPRLPDLGLTLDSKATNYIDMVTFANVPIPGFHTRAERMFVSHLIEFSRPATGVGPFPATPLYSAYETKDLPDAKDAFATGWTRLLDLKSGLVKVIQNEKPTHLIVFSTGWNTGQSKTFDRMKSIQESLKATAEGRDFRPVFIAITWPSTSERLGDTIGSLTYNVKSSDADEVGLVWASTLISQVLIPARDEVQVQGRLTHRPDVVVIGHSFGARVVTWPAFCAGLLPPQGGRQIPLRAPDIVIGLQGAFSVARFVKGEGVEGSPYSQRPPATRFAYTCSENDHAVETFNTLSSPISSVVGFVVKRFRNPKLEDIRLGVPHIGGKTAFSLDSANFRSVIEHRVVVDTKGRLDRALPASNDKIVLIDASKIIRDKPPEFLQSTFSGAHGDVYDKEVGHVIWQIIGQ